MNEWTGISPVCDNCSDVAYESQKFISFEFLQKKAEEQQEKKDRYNNWKV